MQNSGQAVRGIDVVIYLYLQMESSFECPEDCYNTFSIAKTSKNDRNRNLLGTQKVFN
jgi:hypothetical protein